MSSAFPQDAKGIRASVSRLYIKRMPDGRFSPPWTVEEYRGISYIVRDANRFAIAHIYFASDSSHTRYLMSKDEARIIAATIARVPEMVMRARADNGDLPETDARYPAAARA